MNKKQKLFGMAIIAIITLALSFTACKDKPDDPPPPQPPQNASIAFRDKSITVDYSGSGLTQAQADTVTPKLQEIFDLFKAGYDLSIGQGLKFSIMINRPGFKIVIIPGNSGCGRDGDTMTLGADFVLANDMIGIIVPIEEAIDHNLFADLPPQPATITQADGLAFDGTVTIKTSDQYTAADWDAVVANVITAFNAAYEAASSAGKGRLRTVFGNDAGGEIVLVNNLANNWEVRDNEFKTLYLKTGSIATADYVSAMARMMQSTPAVGKATPPKDRVFLAYMFSHSGNLILS